MYNINTTKDDCVHHKLHIFSFLDKSTFRIDESTIYAYLDYTDWYFFHLFSSLANRFVNFLGAEFETFKASPVVG